MKYIDDMTDEFVVDDLQPMKDFLTQYDYSVDIHEVEGGCEVRFPLKVFPDDREATYRRYILEDDGIHFSCLELEDEKIGTIVLNCHTIKPLDGNKILEVVKKTDAVVTIEEHQIAGGLGGAVAELLAKKYLVPMEFIGLQNTFGESGKPTELIEKYGMGVKDIKAAVKKVLRRKK